MEVADNLAIWNGEYDWPQAGDEWSAAWGGVAHQWWHTLFPRLQGYVPAQRILEIAPGYGRWTHFLKDLCEEMVIVDLAQGCIDHCRKRFAEDSHVQAHANDGKSLAMVEDQSIDLAFSFDSLVHVEHDVIDAYLGQLASKLTANGIGFIHHSNMGAYGPLEWETRNPHWRGLTVSAPIFEHIAASHGLRCVGQETLTWGDDHTLLNDCISVFTPAGSAWERDNVKLENPTFSTQEMANARALSQMYPPSRRSVAFTAR
jgi:SAM-dependent methyltransferase